MSEVGVFDFFLFVFIYYFGFDLVSVNLLIVVMLIGLIGCFIFVYFLVFLMSNVILDVVCKTGNVFSYFG